MRARGSGSGGGVACENAGAATRSNSEIDRPTFTQETRAKMGHPEKQNCNAERHAHSGRTAARDAARATSRAGCGAAKRKGISFRAR